MSKTKWVWSSFRDCLYFFASLIGQNKYSRFMILFRCRKSKKSSNLGSQLFEISEDIFSSLIPKIDIFVLFWKSKVIETHIFSVTIWWYKTAVKIWLHLLDPQCNALWRKYWRLALRGHLLNSYSKIIQ